MAQTEFSYYIPSYVTINDDGTIDDMSQVYSFDDRDMLFEKSFTGYGMPPIKYLPPPVFRCQRGYGFNDS